MTTTYEQLCAILVRDYQLQPEALALTAPLEDLGIDSLGLAELLFNVEDELRITLPPEAVDLETVGDVVRYLDELCLLYTSPSPRDRTRSRMPSSA